MAQKTWIIKGTLKLRELPLSYKDGDKWVPLSGATIKISANEGIRWNSWGTVTTAADGSFVMRKKKDASKRKIRVEVQFKNKNTVVYGENASLLSKALTLLKPIGVVNNANNIALNGILTHVSRLTYKSDFYTLKESNERNTGGGDYEFDYGTISIGKKASGYLYEHASIFYGCEKLRKHLSQMGQPFAKKIAVKYPHNNELIPDLGEMSYCSPINNCVYLVKNSQRNSLYADGQITFNTLYHELMHLWAYGYSKGEDNLAWQLIVHGGTHDGLQAKTYTAFHEAWAEHGSNVMLKNIFNQTSDIYGGHDYWKGPFYKPALIEMGITNIGKVDRQEFGWMHVFNCLTCDGLINFNTHIPQEHAPLFARVDQLAKDTIPTIDIYDLMQVFRMPDPYTISEMNLVDFMDRVQKVAPEINSKMRAGYMKVFDPSESKPPRDCF
ncbi:hypothetical protein HRM2_24070 [Desulforapulum autotrophicum HRM2]|uniref:Uncharacterized protein n=1 Tax=Desulforapulum autotrophicum (strain ATCC 43914 / DSM 3382 / VKM B-1955 / HRM2) TaxID=177437 RepID=C0QFT3_DESAH|nr:hypothetical protein [Desulforapulum autotrophicum]ACN15501.1 hypothetical protein HRM2_24070 [Desulforapulum autotrophicum HRM2]